MRKFCSTGEAAAAHILPWPRLGRRRDRVVWTLWRMNAWARRFASLPALSLLRSFNSARIVAI
jgi:hypothetical protein